MTAQEKPWFVFYGTLTTVVYAPDALTAAEHAREALFPPTDFGRVAPPSSVEMHVRAPRESDRRWVEQSGEQAFIDALAGVNTGGRT